MLNKDEARTIAANIESDRREGSAAASANPPADSECFHRMEQLLHEIRGRAETLPTGGHEIMADFDPELIRLTPSRIIGWGIEGDMFQANSRSVG